MRSRMERIAPRDLKHIPVKENGEALVNLAEACPSVYINLDPLSKAMQELPENTCFVRKTVAKKLCRVQKALPGGIRLMVWDGHRKIRVQKKMHAERYKRLKKLHPVWSAEKLQQETSKFVAPVEPTPPHATGGTVDITLVDRNLEPLDMGTFIDTFTKQSYTDAKDISPQAQANRALLVRVMEQEGFVNYPTEWWHWSYGDRYWAAAKGKPHAIYDGL